MRILSDRFTIVDETDQRALLAEAFTRSRGEEAWKQCTENTKASDILEDFSHIKMSLLPGQPPFHSALNLDRIEEILEAYEQIKREENVADYDDILFTFNAALDNPAILSFYRQKWRFILVDEFQDTIAVQYAILRKLADTGTRNLSCVGDNDQSIYSFRQANVRNILDFPQYWPDTTLVRRPRSGSISGFP